MLLAILEQGSTEMDNVLVTLLSSAIVSMYPVKVTLMENSSSKAMIGDLIFGNGYSKQVKENTIYNTGKNMEEKIAQYVSNRYDKKIKRSYLVEVVDNKLYYIPQLNRLNKIIFDYSFSENLYTYIEEADIISDITMISTRQSMNLSSPVILNDADIIVVRMPLSHKMFVEFLDKYHSIVYKCYFVCMPPDYVSKEEIKKAVSVCGVPKSQIIILPCTEKLEMHIQNGKVVDYVQNNIMCSRVSSEYLFISRLKKLIRLIVNNNVGGLSYQVHQIAAILGTRNNI